MARKARTRDSVQALSKVGELADGEYRIFSQPPGIVPARDLAATYGISAEEIGQVIRDQLRGYRTTLQLDRRRLLEHFEIVDMARKVVGVGSVGTRAYIVLLHGRDAEDPLFLQIKEATASVLEDHLPKSRFAQPGERVVQGQRMMQAVSDIFLGWTKGAEEGRYFYWRQLRDMKGSTDVASMRPAALAFYARMWGGRWPGPTPSRETRSRSPRTWAAPRVTRRSPISRWPTPTRTSATSRTSSRRSDRDGWTSWKACEACRRRKEISYVGSAGDVPGTAAAGTGTEQLENRACTAVSELFTPA